MIIFIIIISKLNMNETEEQIKEIKKEKRTVLIQIKTTPDIREDLDNLKNYRKTTITELIEYMIKFHYNLTYYSGEAFEKERIKDLLEDYFDIKEMPGGLLITEKTK